MFIKKEITITTKKPFEIVDITTEVKKFVKENKLKNGLINVFTRHTTTAIKINEAEDGFFKDIEKWCDKNVSLDNEYHHDDLKNRDPKTMCDSQEECLNGHAHVRQMLLGSASETIPVENEKLLLGTWQKILFFELDHTRERKVIISFTGE